VQTTFKFNTDKLKADDSSPERKMVFMSSVGNSKEKEVLKFKTKKMPFIHHAQQSDIESPVKVASPFKRAFNSQKKQSGFGSSSFQTPRKSMNDDKKKPTAEQTDG